MTAHCQLDVPSKKLIPLFFNVPPLKKNPNYSLKLIKYIIMLVHYQYKDQLFIIDVKLNLESSLYKNLYMIWLLIFFNKSILKVEIFTVRKILHSRIFHKGSRKYAYTFPIIVLPFYIILCILRFSQYYTGKYI